MSGPRCPICGGYGWIGEICKTCGNPLPKAPPPRKGFLDKIDTSLYAKLLKEKEEKERRNKIPQLSDCPYCHEHSLFYNPIQDRFECFNPECQIHSKPVTAGTEEYQSILLTLEKEKGE